MCNSATTKINSRCVLHAPITCTYDTAIKWLNDLSNVRAIFIINHQHDNVTDGHYINHNE